MNDRRLPEQTGRLVPARWTWLFGALGILACSLPVAGFSADSSVATRESVATDAGELDEIVVTGVRQRRLVNVPKSVSIITAVDIALASSPGLADLLAREANVNFRSVTGNDKFAGLDIRGMGDTFVSNVLVLVDGVRLNPPDMAGADLAGISLDQIERIEIVRGANAVRYGSGAVGGVVNIITRKDDREPHVSGRLRHGSHDTTDAAVAAGIGGSGDLAWSTGAKVSWQESDGYRDNGHLDRTNLQFDADAESANGLSVDAGIHIYADDYGLPGPISAEAFAGTNADRRHSNSPDDGGETRDNRYRLGIAHVRPTGHEVHLTGHVRDRTNEYILGYTPLLTRAEQQDAITEETAGLELLYHLPIASGPGRLELDFGATHSATDYVRQQDGVNRVGVSSEIPAELDDTAFFASASWFFNDSWQLSAGQRRDVSTLDSSVQSLEEVCDYETIPGIPFPIPVNCRPQEVTSGLRNERWRNTATEIGMVATLSPVSSGYVSHNRAYRVPNVDEFALATPDLRPQKSSHWEAGVRLTPLPSIGLGMSVFHMEVRDEILYGEDPSSGESLNRNADERTRRVGGELEMRWQALPALGVLLNAGYTRARFESATRLPLVPEWSGSIGLRWTPLRALTASLSSRYVGDRPDGNDFAGNTYPELDAYVVTDLALLWRPASVSWSLGIDNLFDEVATTSAYSGAIYPLPDRQIFLSVAHSL